MFRKFCWLILALPAVSPAQRLSEPWHSVLADSAFLPNSGYKWQRGFMLAFDLDRSTVFAMDRSGKLAMQSRIWPQDAEAVRIFDMAASPSGGFAVAISAVSRTGAGMSGIIWLDASGKNAKLVRTEGAGPHRVCFSDDGTLWALVRAHDREGHETADYDMLRHYGRDGALIGTALPRKRFSHKLFPGSASASLTASHDRIGLYLDLSRTWVEISNSGEVLGHWRTPENNYQFTRTFLSASNEVYFAYESRQIERGKSEVGISRFDKTSGALVAVDASAIRLAENYRSNPLLFGIDEDSFVIGDSYRLPKLMWAKLQ